MQLISKKTVTVASLAVIVLCGAFFIYLAQSPVSGTAYATVFGADGSYQLKMITLRGFVVHDEQTAALGIGGRVVGEVPSPDNSAVAYLVADDSFTTSIVLKDARGVQTLSSGPGLRNIPAWSSDSKSIAYAEITASTTPYDEAFVGIWSVIRALTNGATLQVGYGYRPRPATGATTIALTQKGIALLAYKEAVPKVVVTSPVPPTNATPLAISVDTTRVAWVAPADHSLQIFENKNGTFLPLLVKQGFAPDTMVFSPDGNYLLVALTHGAETSMSLLTVQTGVLNPIGTLQGQAVLTAWIAH